MPTTHDPGGFFGTVKKSTEPPKSKLKFPHQSDQSAPYDWEKLKPPLSVLQKFSIKAYIHRVRPDLESWIKPDTSDQELITLYAAAAGAIADRGPSIYGPLQPLIPPITGGVGGITSALDFLKNLAAALFDPKFWLRVIEVLGGLVLVGVGVAKASGSAGNTLRKIPVYGKAIPK